jgi:hypothetical protein
MRRQYALFPPCITTVLIRPNQALERMQPVEARPITPEELAVLRQALLRGASAPVPESAVEALQNLAVIGICPCGCKSVYFAPESGDDRIIADTWGKTAEGEFIGVMVWSRGGSITSLDLVDHLSAGKLPLPESIGERVG